MHPIRTTRPLLCIVLQAAVLLFGSYAALGQAAARPPLSDKQPLDKQPVMLSIKRKKLTEVISQLSDALGRNIVVDDEPSEQRIDLEVTGTARDALDAVAKLYDYSWSLNKRDVILMRKAFHDPATLPQMNLPEMRQMAQEAVNVFSVFHCTPGGTGSAWGDPMRTLARSFTGAQLEQMRAGKTLHTTELSLEQGTLLQQIVVNHAFSALLDGWQTLSNALEQLPAISLEMRATTERRRGIATKGAVLEQVRQGSDGKEVRTRLTFVPDGEKPNEKPKEKKP